MNSTADLAIGSYPQSFNRVVAGKWVKNITQKGWDKLRKSVTGEKDIIFDGHGSRHLPPGLNAADVEAAIAQDIPLAIKNASSIADFWGKVVVQGETIIYRASPRPNGVINVGTYHPPR